MSKDWFIIALLALFLGKLGLANDASPAEKKMRLEEVMEEEKNPQVQLWLASQRGDGLVVRRLLESKTDPNNSSDFFYCYNQTPLGIAAQNGHDEVIRVLLAANADVNKGAKRSPVCSAIKDGHKSTVRLLAEAKAYLEIQSSFDTPLFSAVANGHLEIAQLLLDLKTDPDRPSICPFSSSPWMVIPLRSAVLQGSLPLVRTLLAAKARVSAHNGVSSPLNYVQDIDIMRELLRAKADPNEVAPLYTGIDGGCSVLEYRLKTKQLTQGELRLLLESKADPSPYGGADALFKIVRSSKKVHRAPDDDLY